MTKEEAKYFNDRIDQKVAEAVAALTPSQQQDAKASAFADKYMRLISGQEYVSQGLFRQFLKEVDFSNVEAAIAAAEAATQAVANFAVVIQQTEAQLAEITERISVFVEALRALNEKIEEVEQDIPDLAPERVDDVRDAIDNMDTEYTVYIDGLDETDRMLRERTYDDKETYGDPVYGWVTERGQMPLLTDSESPEVNDPVYNVTHSMQIGRVDSVTPIV